MKKINFILIIIIALIFSYCGGKKKYNNKENTEKHKAKQTINIPKFNQDSAYSFVKHQVDFGPRVPNTKAHKECLKYLSKKLESYGADVTIQKGNGTLYNKKNININNIIGTFNPSAKFRIILAAHWDSRPFADQDKDPTKHKTPIPGANDGASGVGVLLEIARHINMVNKNIGIDIIFFDVEDYGIPSFYNRVYNENSWCIGSQYWAKKPHKSDYKADFGILLDMVGAPGAKFYKELYSIKYANNIVEKVWNKAINSGFEGYFISKKGGYIIDDHLPINEIAKIPVINIIHYDINTESGFNPHWHTIKDDMKNIDKNTLYAVGQTVLNIIFD